MSLEAKGVSCSRTQWTLVDGLAKVWNLQERDLPCRSVPVIFTEASVTEGVIPLTARRGRGAVRLFCAAPFVGVEGDAGCLVAVGSCRSGEGITNMCRLCTSVHVYTRQR